MKIEYGYKFVKPECLCSITQNKITIKEKVKLEFYYLIGLLVPVSLFAGFVTIAIKYDLPLEPFFISFATSFAVTHVLVH